MAALLDTNILLRHLLNDDPAQSPKATAIMDRISRGGLEVQITDLVVFETVFVLDRRYKVPRAHIEAGMRGVLALAGVHLPGKSAYGRVFDLYTSTPLSFADCYHVALMERLRISEVLSFDRDFDRVPGITRRED